MSKVRALHQASGVLSQFLNTGANLALAVLVARSSSASDFGAWAAVNVFAVLAIQASRSLVSTPMMIDRGIGESVGIQTRNAVVSSNFLLGVLMLAPCALTGYVLGGVGGKLLIATAFGVPFVMVIDALRHVAFRSNLGGHALALDAASLGLQAGCWWYLLSTDSATAVTITLGWGTGAALAVLAVLLGLGVKVSLTQARKFFQVHRESGLKLLVESMLGNGSLQVLPAILAVVVGLEAAGALRASQTIFGAVTVAVMALTPIATTHAVRALQLGRPAEVIVVPISVVGAAVAAATVFAFALYPDLGSLVLGSSWQGASAILIPMGIVSALRGHTAVVPIVLRAKRGFNALVRLRVVSTPLFLLLPVASGAVFGVEGAAWGLSLGALLVTIQSQRVLARNVERI